jgi:lactoylglutathione lyase
MRLDHGSLLVSDVRRSVDFYTGALGLTEVPRPPTFDSPGAWLAIGETQQLHLVGEGEPGRTVEMNPPWDPAEVANGYTNHLAFHVDDLDAALQRAREHGVDPAGEVFARGDGVRRTFVTDPDGHVIELMETGVPVTGSEPRLQVPRRSG